jgi:hypothetical protein
MTLAELLEFTIESWHSYGSNENSSIVLTMHKDGVRISVAFDGVLFQTGTSVVGNKIAEFDLSETPGFKCWNELQRLGKNPSEYDQLYIRMEGSTEQNKIELLCGCKNIRVQDSMSSTVLIVFGKKNLNDRIYDKDRISNLDSIIQQAASGLLFGEIEGEVTNSASVTISNVSHKIERVWITEHALMGSVRTVNSPEGRKLQKLMTEGIEFVFRPRGMGNVGLDNRVHVELVTFDAVRKTNDAFANVLI